MTKPEGIYTILFITHYSEMYGANKSMCQLILELKNNYDIHPLVLIPRNGSICKVLEDSGIEYKISHYYWWVNHESGLFKKILNIRKQFINLLKSRKLFNLYKDSNIDIVYSNSVTINIGYYLSAQLKKPHIWHFRETLDSFNFKFSLGYSFAKYLFIRGASKYIVISDFVMQEYKKILPTNKVVRIYNGISLSAIYSTFKTPSNDTLNLCCIGVICEQKNQLEILEAINILKKEGITNVRLHLIGSSKKEYLRQIIEYIKHNKLDEMVCIHGHQSNVNKFLNTMDVGIVSARDEAFGRVSIEYMLHKMPVIASLSGANQEIVKDGINGHLYELDNPKQLAEKIDFLLKNPIHTKDIGSMAFRYAQLNFSSEQNAKEVYNIIHDLLEKNSLKYQRN